MRKKLWAWARVLGALAILVVLFTQLGSEAFVDGVRAVDRGAIIAALSIGFFTTVSSAWRWSLVTRRLGVRIPLWQAVAAYYRALLLNAALPGGVLGDVHRAVRHGRDAGDVGGGVRAVVLERAAGQVMLVTAGVAVLFSQPSILPAGTHDTLTLIGLGILLLALLLLTLAPRAARRWVRSESRWRRAVATAITDARYGLLARDTWPGVLLASVAALFGHVGLFVVAARVAGSPAPLLQLIPLLLLGLLAMGLPVSVGGWGPREGVCALAFAGAGLGATAGVKVAVVYGVLAIVAALPGIVVLILGRRRSDDAGEVVLEEHVLAEREPADRHG